MGSPVDLAFYAVGPESDKAPIIFMHGLSVSKEHWGDIPHKVAHSVKRKAYVVDARNHGDSPWTDHFSFDVNVTDLMNFMDKHKIQKAILVGHSMGGITGMKATLANPHRVEKLIVEDIGVQKVHPKVTDLIYTRLHLLHSSEQEIPEGIDELSAKMFVLKNVYAKMPDEYKVMYKAMPPTDQVADKVVSLKKTNEGRYQLKTNMKTLKEHFRDRLNHMSEYCGTYDGATKFIYGEVSPFCVQNQETEIKKFFPNAEFICMKDCMHSIHDEKTQEFTEILVKIIAENDL